MEDAYSKVVAVFIAAILMFLVPVMYFAQRQESIVQMYLFTRTTEFVDAVCNKGEFTKAMYETYQNSVASCNGGYEIKMTARKKELVMVSDYQAGVSYQMCENYYYNKDILRELLENGKYGFSIEDYFQITVTKKGRSPGEIFLSLFGKETGGSERKIVYYGGTIKYENY